MNPGEIYFADLYEAGVRPIVVISRASLNRGGYVVAVPLTTAHFERRRSLPNCVPILAGEFGLAKDSVAQCEAILSVERSQIDLARGVIGTLNAETIRELIRAVGYVIESDCEPS
jgi:mRNA-degrading endonuclease toxin of MazEF toxin-antitoxin module